MKEGKTSTGFNYVIEDERIDDWEFLETLNKIDKGEDGLVVDMAHSLLGDDQLNKLKTHVKELEGRVSITGMFNELRDILNGEESTKNL